MQKTLEKGTIGGFCLGALAKNEFSNPFNALSFSPIDACHGRSVSELVTPLRTVTSANCH
jgi:hypothetical protein